MIFDVPKNDGTNYVVKHILMTKSSHLNWLKSAHSEDLTLENSKLKITVKKSNDANDMSKCFARVCLITQFGRLVVTVFGDRKQLRRK